MHFARNIEIGWSHVTVPNNSNRSRRQKLMQGGGGQHAQPIPLPNHWHIQCFEFGSFRIASYRGDIRGKPKTIYGLGCTRSLYLLLGYWCKEPSRRPIFVSSFSSKQAKGDRRSGLWVSQLVFKLFDFLRNYNLTTKATRNISFLEGFEL